MKKLIYLVLAVALVSVPFLYSGYSSALHYSLNPLSSDRITVDIAPGSSASAIADLLADKGLIKSTSAFSLYIKRKGHEGDLKAGRMVLQENFTLPQIVDILVEGRSEEYPVTLLEGWTAAQMAQYLEEKGLTTAEDFLACLNDCEFDFNFLPDNGLEGYLYPDTYFVTAGSYTDERFITRLISTLKSKLSDEDWAAINASERDLAEIMTMASIVEREERQVSQKATVAGILWNRFDANMGLGADATVLYALGRTSGGLNFKDLQVDSPYNTRKYAGLPPGPISNPGITSIRAALYPEKTNYWYYLHDADGGIHYARNLDEHNSNKARYIN